MTRWLSVLALLILGAPTIAATANPDAVRWFTLGTGSGPRPQVRRAQPANLLIAGDTTILIDVGDGAAQQLGKVGVPLESVDAVFISHLHFDHTGGLFAVIGRRFQILAPNVLTIYGPPGTRATVDGLLEAMAPAVGPQANIRARAPNPPEATVRVVELRDGWTGQVGSIRVTAASNSHYVLAPDGPGKSDTYAFRFDAGTRSIAYTGDTGPSEAVERLASGADVLFAESMEPVSALADVRAARPDLTGPALAAVTAHFNRQHLSPTEAGLMARRAGVKALVITHNAVADAGLTAAKSAITKNYTGPVTFADDLQEF